MITNRERIDSKPPISIKMVLVNVVTVIASILWIIFCSIVFIFNSGLASFDPSGLIKVVISTVPLVLIWVIARLYFIATETRAELTSLNDENINIRDEIASLEKWTRQLFDTLYHDLGRASVANDQIPVETKPDELTEDKPFVPVIQDIPDTSSFQPPQSENTYIDSFSMMTSVLNRALNFAEDEYDTEGFAALETAMENDKVSEILNMAQELIHKLAMLNVITDELQTDCASPADWRHSAPTLSQGGMISLGGIVSRSEVSIVVDQLKNDQEFEELAEQFIEKMITFIKQSVTHMNDEEIVHFFNTRTVRTLMLLCQAMG